MKTGIPKRLRKRIVLKQSNHKYAGKEDTDYMCFYCPVLTRKFMVLQAIVEGINVPELIVKAINEYIARNMGIDNLYKEVVKLIREELKEVEDKYSKYDSNIREKYLKEVEQFLASKTLSPVDARYIIDEVDKCW